MATLEIVMTSMEVSDYIPYCAICTARYGSVWETIRRKRRWKEEFTEEEREAAARLFPRAHDLMLGRGVPDTVRMSTKTYVLWQKLGAFCCSL